MDAVPEAPVDAVPNRFIILTAFTVAAAFGSVLAFATTAGWQLTAASRFWVLAPFVIAGELLPIPAPGREGRDKVTVSTGVAYAVLLSVGVLPACAVYALASVIADVSARTQPVKVLFNAGHYALAMTAGGAVLAAGGVTPPVALTDPHILLVFAVAIVMFVVNHVVAGAGAGLLLGVPVGRYLREDVGFQAWTAGCVLAFAPAVVASAYASLVLVPIAFVPMVAIYFGGRHAEEELLLARRRAEIEERYRLALDATGDGMFDLDLHGGRAFWSERLLELLGYRAEDLPVSPQAWVAKLVHPEDQVPFGSGGRADWNTATRFEVASRLRQANGAYVPYLVRGWTQHDERGRAYRVIGSISDLTASQRAEHQRLAIARDLHDGVVQDLAAALLFLAQARALLPDEPVETQRLVEVAVREIESSLGSLRLLLESLRSDRSLPERSSSVQDEVRAVIEEFTRRTPVLTLKLAVEADDDHNLNPVALQTVSSVLREALRNVVQHAAASTATVAVRADAAGLLLDVRDDGVGFDPATVVPGHYGIAGMNERAQRAGGTLEVLSGPGGGTHVRLRLPRPFVERERPLADLAPVGSGAGSRVGVPVNAGVASEPVHASAGPDRASRPRERRKRQQ